MKELLEDSKGIIEKVKERGLFYEKALDYNYFQSEHSDRSELKQDFTPKCLCDLVSRMTDGGSYLDVCAGVGGLSIPILDKAKKLYLEEYSERAIPFLLLNLAFNNVAAYVFHRDVISKETFHAYELTKGERYSVITEMNGNTEISQADNVIMNPPYSLKWESKKYLSDERFLEYGIAPNSKADFSFLLHGLFHLGEKGVMLAIVPHGLLFRGGTETEIRRKLIEKNLLDAVIGLPDKLFLNTGIPVCILVFKKGRKGNSLLFVDSSKHFVKTGKQNVMTEEHIEKLLSVYKHRMEVVKYSRVVEFNEITENDFNLNIPRYVDTTDVEEIPDLEQTMLNLMEIDEEERRIRAELYSMVSELSTEVPQLKKGLEASLQRFKDD